MSSFRELLRTDRRYWKKWSQAELAARLDVKQQTISNWESGKAIPSEAQLDALAQVLGPESEIARSRENLVFDVPTRGSVIVAPSNARRRLFEGGIAQLLPHLPHLRQLGGSPLDLGAHDGNVLKTLLPEHLRDFIYVAKKVSGLERRYLYGSEAVVASLIDFVPEDPEFFLDLARATIKMALAVDHYPAPAQTNTVLFIRTSENATFVKHQLREIEQDAMGLGVTFHICADLKSIAETIVLLEHQYKKDAEEFRQWLSEKQHEAADDWRADQQTNDTDDPPPE